MHTFFQKIMVIFLLTVVTAVTDSTTKATSTKEESLNPGAKNNFYFTKPCLLESISKKQ